MRFSIRGLMRFGLLLAVAPAAFATTWYVNGVSGSNNKNCKSPQTACKTIGHAISLAHSGDSIKVAAATYTENLTISKSLIILGSSVATTIVDGGGTATVVTISSASDQVTLSGLTIQNGSAKSGGGIYNSGTLRLINSTVDGNIAWIPCHFPPPCIHGGGVSGGGITNSGTLTINNSTISNNQAVFGLCNRPPCYANGGGILNVGTLTLNNSTVTGNGSFAGYIQECYASGGGIDNYGTLRIINSTFTGNYNLVDCTKSNCSGLGGGINNASGTLALNNVTFSGNWSTVTCTGPSCLAQGGGINDTASASVQNSIVANSTSPFSGYKSGRNCSGTEISKGYNLSTDGTCNFTGPGDMNNINPMLGALQNNGGPTETMALASGSPAVDAGNPSGCTDGQGHLLKTDQRGKARPDSEDKTGCDMGAYERQSD